MILIRLPHWLFALALILAANAARAQSPAPMQADVASGEVSAIAESAQALPPDVRLVIDVSGSMKRNDPNNLRQPAVDLLVKLLPENSRAGVWTFGRWINMLVKHREVDDAWRQDALSQSKEINSAGLFTNIGEALEKAAYDLPKKEGTHRNSIILLTDGMVDIAKDPEKNTQEWRRIVDEVLPRLQEANVAIHTIALSDNADTDLLNKLSLGTDGIAAVAKTADELMKIFLKAFEVAAPMEQVPLSDEGFVIDSSVEEFTALIFRQKPDEQSQLVGPDGETYTAQNSDSKYIRWYRDNKYDLITVKQPLEGQWQVIADMDPESRITVVSNLNLRVKPLPNNILKGQQLSLSFLLSEDGKTVQSPDFLSLMNIRASMMGGRDEFELSEIWQQQVNTKIPPKTGVFTLALPEFAQEGIYQLSLVVDGKSFVREFTHQFATRQPFGADIAEELKDGSTQYLLSARAYAVDVEVNKTQVIATVTMPDDRKKVIPLTPTELDTWQTTIRPEREGRYIAGIRTRGEYADGTSFDIEIEPIEFVYSLDQGFVENEKPFVAEETPQATAEPAKPEASPEPTPQAQEGTTEQASEGIPPWMLYLALGLGNLLLFGLGFFAYKKIMGNSNSNSDTILDEFSEEKVAQETAPPPESEPEPSKEQKEDELDDEEEPPMEDIDPGDDDQALSDAATMMAAEVADDAASTAKLEEEQSLGDAEPDAEAPQTETTKTPAPPMEETKVAATSETMDEDDLMEALDDLDQMAMEAEEASAASPKADEADNNNMDDDEDDDMVAAMLKAQGLDLAEDELDDAISSLIDELENHGVLDDDDKNKKKK